VSVAKLPARSQRPSRTVTRGQNADLPKAVLLVDRAVIVKLLVAAGATRDAGLAVVCIDGTPAPVVGRLVRAFRAGRRAPVLYLHDAASVVYPFAIEPLASLVRHRDSSPIAYRDLGLPPLGASARRFGDPAFCRDEPILHLEDVPPATLLRYCAKLASSLTRAPLL
jgi:hypothetical protein